MSDNTFNTQQVNTSNKRRDDVLNIVLAIAVSFICSLSIPFSANSIVGIVTVIACSAFVIRVTSRKILTVLILLGLFSTFGLSNGLPLITILLAATVGCGAYAWLISRTESAYLAVIPALAYAISTVITKNWFGSLLTLIYIVPAILLAQTYEKMNTRVSSLLRVSLGYLSFIALAIVLSVLYFTGEFRTEIISDFLNTLRDSTVKLLSAMEVSLINGETQKLMSETDAFNYVSQIISLIPALITVLCSAMAYFAQKIQFSIFVYTEGESEFNDLRKIFIMSPVSAVIFIVSFLVYTVTATSSSSAVAATVSSNLYLMLMPGLALMGVKCFFANRQGSASLGCFTGLLPIMLIALLIFAPGAAPVTAACYGAYSAIEGPVRKYLAKKKDD